MSNDVPNLQAAQQYLAQAIEALNAPETARLRTAQRCIASIVLLGNLESPIEKQVHRLKVRWSNDDYAIAELFRVYDLLLRYNTAAKESIEKLELTLIDGPLAGRVLLLPLARQVVHVEDGIAYVYKHVEEEKYKFRKSFKAVEGLEAMLEQAQPRELEVGNVVANKDTGLKRVIFQPRPLEANEEFVCDNPHDDGDLSYICRMDHCRCMQ